MADLTKEIKGVICMGCQFIGMNYRKIENLMYGFKAESILCVPCWKKYIDELWKFGRELGSRETFNGDLSDSKNLEEERKRFLIVQDKEEYLDHLTN